MRIFAGGFLMGPVQSSLIGVVRRDFEMRRSDVFVVNLLSDQIVFKTRLECDCLAGLIGTDSEGFSLLLHTGQDGGDGRVVDRHLQLIRRSAATELDSSGRCPCDIVSQLGAYRLVNHEARLYASFLANTSTCSAAYTRVRYCWGVCEFTAPLTPRLVCDAPVFGRCDPINLDDELFLCETPDAESPPESSRLALVNFGSGQVLDLHCPIVLSTPRLNAHCDRVAFLKGGDSRSIEEFDLARRETVHSWPVGSTCRLHGYYDTDHMLIDENRHSLHRWTLERLNLTDGCRATLGSFSPVLDVLTDGAGLVVVLLGDRLRYAGTRVGEISLTV